MTKLTRNQRRQMEKLAPHVERVTDTDCAFFEQHQDRRHRVRHACEAEIAQMEIMDSKVWHAPHGCRWFAIVREVRSGQRIRIFVSASATAETGLQVDEELACELFDLWAPGYAREIAALLSASSDGRMA